MLLRNGFFGDGQIVRMAVPDRVDSDFVCLACHFRAAVLLISHLGSVSGGQTICLNLYLLLYQITVLQIVILGNLLKIQHDVICCPPFIDLLDFPGSWLERIRIL